MPKIFGKNKRDGNFSVPLHLAIIMDGNGRWAKKRGLPRTAGHKQGAEVFKKVCRYLNSIGVSYLTVYAFSTENWKRPRQEVDTIMGILKEYLKDAKRHKEENMRTLFIGDRDALTPEIRELMREAEEGSADATGLTINIAINYGGRAEIANATKAIAKKVQSGEISPEDISEQMLNEHLYTSNMPDPEIILRTGGEMRSSNFLLWQSAYSEYIITNTLWPDIKEADIKAAIDTFNNRNRRFGGV